MGKDKRKKKEHDFAVTAFRVMQEATGQIVAEPENPTKKNNFDAKALGHLGGLKGEKARAKKLSPEQRSKIAQKAARARWSKE